jgi:hypothetical protein
MATIGSQPLTSTVITTDIASGQVVGKHIRVPAVAAVRITEGREHSWSLTEPRQAG